MSRRGIAAVGRRRRSAHVVNHVEVVLVALGADGAVVDGGLDGAARLMAVGAVGEIAAVQHRPHLREEMRQLLWCEIYHAELLDAGSVY